MFKRKRIPIKNKKMTMAFIRSLHKIYYEGSLIGNSFPLMNSKSLMNNAHLKKHITIHLHNIVDCLNTIPDDIKEDWKEIKWKKVEYLQNEISASFFDDDYYSKLAFVEYKLPKFLKSLNDILENEIFILRDIYYQHKHLQTIVANLSTEDFYKNDDLTLETYHYAIGIGNDALKIEDKISPDLKECCDYLPWAKLRAIQGDIFVDNYGPDYTTVWNASRDILSLGLDSKIDECLKNIY